MTEYRTEDGDVYAAGGSVRFGGVPEEAPADAGGGPGDGEAPEAAPGDGPEPARTVVQNVTAGRNVVAVGGDAVVVIRNRG